MPFGIAVIDPDENPVGDIWGDLDDPYPRLLERGERADRRGRDVDAVKQEILVPAGIVDEEQLAAVGRPEILADRALLLGG